MENLERQRRAAHAACLEAFDSPAPRIKIIIFRQTFTVLSAHALQQRDNIKIMASIPDCKLRELFRKTSKTVTVTQ